jgi:hypothetical protein
LHPFITSITLIDLPNKNESKNSCAQRGAQAEHQKEPLFHQYFLSVTSLTDTVTPPRNPSM